MAMSFRSTGGIEIASGCARLAHASYWSRLISAIWIVAPRAMTIVWARTLRGLTDPGVVVDPGS